MTHTKLISTATGKALRNIARELHHRYEGRFGEETIQDLLEDSYLSLTRSASGSTPC